MMLKPTIFPVKVKVSKLYRREFAKLLQANDDFAKIDAGRESNVDILGMSREEIGAILVNEPSFRASQVYRFIYAECGESWKDAIRLPIRIREVLSQTVGADVFRGRVDSRWVSMDGTCKFLIEVNPGRHVECKIYTTTYF